jgi:hypothetical protein
MSVEQLRHRCAAVNFFGAVPDRDAELWGAFRAVERVLGTPSEESRLFRLYENIGPSSFSDEVLAKCPHNLAVLQVNGVEWDDLGDPTRLIKFLGRSSGHARDSNS